MSQEHPFANVEPQIHKLLSLLHEALNLSRRSQRDIERSLGVSQGYLTQMLNGRMRLKVEHVLALGTELGFTPVELFAASRGAGWPKRVRARLAGAPRVPSSPKQEESFLEQDLRVLEAGFDAFVRLLLAGRGLP